jgi:hypothetical protein
MMNKIDGKFSYKSKTPQKRAQPLGRAPAGLQTFGMVKSEEEYAHGGRTLKKRVEGLSRIEDFGTSNIINKNSESRNRSILH